MRADASIRLNFLFLFLFCISVTALADFPVDTPLMKAAGKGDLARVKELVEGGADVNEVRRDNQTALIAAAQSGHEKVALYLVKKGADVNMTNAYGWTALSQAAGAGHVACVKVLIDAGANLQIGDPVLASAIYRSYDQSPSPERLQRTIEVVQLLVEAGANLNEPHRGDSPLMMAARMGNRPIVRILIKAGADQNRARKENISGFCVGKGWTALHYAVRDNHVSIAMDLLETNMASWHLGDVLVLASEKGRIEIVRALIARGADPDSRNQSGESALRLAAWRGREKIVASLLDAGADPNEKGVLGSGAFGGNIKVVRQLIEAGADLRRFGGDAIEIAASEGSANIVVELIKAGVAPSYRDQKGNTILMYYIRGGYAHNIQLLKNNGVDIDARNNQGETALIIAVKRENSDAAGSCLRAGADIHLIDSSGKTALDYAMEKGRLPIIELFAKRCKKELLSNRILMERAFGNPVQTLEIPPPRMEIPAACILDETPLRKFPKQKGEALTHLKFGDPVTWTGKIHPDASFARTFYLEMAPVEGEIGWVPAYAIMFHPKIGAAVQRTPIHSQPSDTAVTEKWMDIPEIVAIKNKNREWLEIEGGKENLTGWIRKSKVVWKKEEVITAGWALNKMREKSSLSPDERVASIIANAPYQRSRLVKELRNLQARKERKKITVNTARDFIQAIGSHREIHLAPGDYFLDDLEIQPNPYVKVNSCFVEIRDVEGLKIVGDPGKRPVSILLRCLYADVLDIRDSKEVTIQNIVLGHAEGNDDCAGGVLYVYNVSNLVIIDTTLFGSGTYGLKLNQVNGLTFKNSSIKECTSSIMSAYSSKNLRFENSRFFENHCKYAPVSISESQGVYYIQCEFKGNTTRGDPKPGIGMFSVYRSSGLQIIRNQIRENTAEYFLDISLSKGQGQQKNLLKPLVEGCEFSDNVFRRSRYITR